MNGTGRVDLEDLSVGRITPAWLATVLVLTAVTAAGVAAYWIQLEHGEITSGLRTIGQGGAAWGLYVIFYVYFVGVSFAGITVAALTRLLGIEALRPLSRMAELLTILALLVSAASIMADLGRPLQGLLYLPRYARPASPFFGTFTLVVAGYLFASLVYFYLAGRADAALCARRSRRLRWFYLLWASGWGGTPEERQRHSRVTFWLSLFILPLLVTAHSTLGFVFGIQGGRPGWFSALQAPGFVVLAGASGIGLLIVVAAAVRRLCRLEDVIRLEAFRWLGNFVWVLIVVYLYFMVVEELTASYAAAAAETHLAHEVVWGEYGPLFWTTVACFVSALGILFAQFLNGRTQIGGAVLAGALVNVGAILKRFLIVVPSQTHGMLLPYPRGSYVPSLVEIGVVAGLFALAALLYVVFVKAFPIVPLDHAVTSATEPPGRIVDGPVRLGAFAATLVGGLALSVVGFAFSLRMGVLYFQDPLLPWSPVVFIVGVMLTFYSAAVYETIPPPSARERGRKR